MGRALHFFVRQCGGVLVVLAAIWMAGCGGGAASTGGGNTGGGTGSPNITVSVSPKTAAIAASTQTQQYTAAVTEDPKNLGVTWRVDTVKGGNATVGSISNSGVYTPPASGGSHTITAWPTLQRALRSRSWFLISPASSPGITTWRAMAATPMNLPD